MGVEEGVEEIGRVGIVESLVLLAAVTIAAAAFVSAQRLQHQRTLRITEMVHEERMAAINQGMELPPHDTLDTHVTRPATAASRWAPAWC